jgi:hypothetical protein
LSSSGVISTSVASNYELSIEWTSTQNTTSNYSTVTAKMYWEADRYGSVNSSTVKDGAIIIDGTTYTFSGSGLADLNPGQKKLIATKSKNVYHNSDGSKSFSLDGYFDAEVTLSGTKYSRINLTAKTFTLDPIPRKSSLTSSPNFTSTENFTLTISRASNSFSHIAYLDVQKRDGSWQYVKSIEFSTSQTSQSSSFNTTDNTRVFDALDGRSSAPIRINLNTYNGSDNLGYNTYNGTVTASKASDGYPVYGEAGADTYMYVDQTVGISIGRDNPSFLQKVEITVGSFTKTINDVSTGTTWTPNSTEQASLYAAIGTTKSSLAGTVKTTTYYNGEQVRTPTTKTITFFVRSSTNAPTFSATGLTYADVNAVTAAVTGSPTTIVQNKSSLRVTIPSSSKATAQNGATIKTYSVTVNGVTKTVNDASGNLNIDYGVISSATNVVATIRATDSRGLSTTVPITVAVVPYTVPVLNYTVRRRNGFEETVDITLTGTISPITVGGAQKNSLQALSGTSSALQYRYKENTTSASFTAWKDFTFTPSGAAYTATPVAEVLDNTKAYIFEIRVSDKLSTNTVSKTVTSGQPIVFMDTVMKTMSVNKFPSKPNGFEVEGDLRATAGLEVYNKPFVNEITTTLPGTPGWYRIAKTNWTDVGNNNATFEVYANVASAHSFARFEAGVAFSQGISLTQTSYSTVGSVPAITTTRIVYPTNITGGTAYLEIYSTRSSTVPITIRMILGTIAATSNWSLITPVAGSVPTGSVSKSLTFQNGLRYLTQDLVFPSLNKGTNYSDGKTPATDYHPVAYHKDAGGFVHLYGLVKGVVYGDVIFTLPAGYTPPFRQVFGVTQSSYADIGRIDIYADGRVSVENTSNTTAGSGWISLSGISFATFDNTVVVP